jgi:hypothetical protein
VVLMLMVGVRGASPAAAQAQSLGGLLSVALDTEDARKIVWYGSLGTLKNVVGVSLNSLDDLNNLDDRQRRLYLLETNGQLYFSAYNGLDNAGDWLQRYGINSFAIERELTAGTGRTRYGILQGGFDSGSLGNTLTAAGYQANGTIFIASDAKAALPAVAVAGNTVIVAQADAIDAVAQPGQVLGNDAAYQAISAVLEDSSTTPGQLISAVIFNGNYLNSTIIGQQKGAQFNNVRGQIGVDELPMSLYSLAAVGYRFDGSQHYWVIALAYADAGAAQQANGMIAQRLGRYVSMDSGAPLFAGWSVNSSVANISGMNVVVATMNAQADVAWVETMRNGDLGFLFAQ